MKRRVSQSQFESHCRDIVDEVARTGIVVEITRDGRKIARVVPAHPGGASAPNAAELLGTLVRGFELSDFDTGARWRSTK
jgi:prevent-host-death family protein